MKQHFDDPPIEVLSAGPRLPLLQARLSRGRMRPSRALVPLRLDYTAPLLIDTSLVPDPATLTTYVQSWYAAGQPRQLIIMGPLPEGLHRRDAIQIEEAGELLHLRGRIAIRQRETLRRIESGRRSLTAQSLGAGAATAMAERARYRLLYLGQSGPDFVALKAALRPLGAEVAAALSPSMALDYLAQHRFCALLLAPGGSDDPVWRVLDHVEPDPDRFGPALIHLERPSESASRPALSEDRLDAILPLTLPSEPLAHLILEHLPPPAGDLMPRQNGQIDMQDVTTGLFSRPFLEAHLGALLEDCDRSGHPLCVLHVSPADDRMCLQTLAKRVTAQLRESDLAARLDTSNLCIVMPDTPYRAALSVAIRLEALCVGAVVWHLVERRRSHSPADLLATAAELRRQGSRRRQA